MSESAIQAGTGRKSSRPSSGKPASWPNSPTPASSGSATYFQEGERHYMVMEFIQGRTLEDMLEEQRPKPVPEDQVLVWAEQLCDVLTYLHSQNPKIIYRDLKPGNVMVVERHRDTVKLIDFGIARFYKPENRRKR
jgi:serine/threonine protein kinase